MGKLSRREFLRWLGWGSLAVPAVTSGIGTLRFLFPNVNYGLSSIVKIGRPEEFPPGIQKLLTGYKLVINSTEKGVYAMSAICTHLGCTVGGVEWGYQYPCHGSKFDRDGLVVRGLAVRPLPWFKIAQSPDGTLEVDLSKRCHVARYFCRLTRN